MKHEKERNIYQFISVFCLLVFILTGWKYQGVKEAYQKAEKEKVTFCKENNTLKCSVVNLQKEVINSLNESERAHDELIECLGDTN